MFGYVRPLKPELLVREFSRYRSVYCGLCVQIRRDYGQLPRLAISYDLTFWSVLLLSLDEEAIPENVTGCILNPFAKKPILQGGTVLEHAAALCVLLAYYKAKDQMRDGHRIGGVAARLLFYRAFKKARRRFPEYEVMIQSAMRDLTLLEAGPPDLKAAEVFGRLIQKITRKAAGCVLNQGPIVEALALLAYDLGQWVYIMDAIDDWHDDCNNKNWNPFGCHDYSSACRQAETLLSELEVSMDRTAALLPYKKDSGLIANSVTLGLPNVRKRVIEGNQGIKSKSSK
jgi:hypothetical protein